MTQTFTVEDFAHARAKSRLLYHLTDAAPDGIEMGIGVSLPLNAAGTQRRQPDIVVFSTVDAPQPWLLRPPLLVVEVLSPASTFLDLVTKRREYAESGIPSYMVVNPARENPGAIELRLDGGEYRDAAQAEGEKVLETVLPFPVRFVPHWLVADGPWRACISAE